VRAGVAADPAHDEHPALWQSSQEAASGVAWCTSSGAAELRTLRPRGTLVEARRCCFVRQATRASAGLRAGRPDATMDRHARRRSGWYSSGRGGGPCERRPRDETPELADRDLGRAVVQFVGTDLWCGAACMPARQRASERAQAEARGSQCAGGRASADGEVPGTEERVPASRTSTTRVQCRSLQTPISGVTWWE
jgi:hypothetical protein